MRTPLCSSFLFDRAVTIQLSKQHTTWSSYPSVVIAFGIYMHLTEPSNNLILPQSSSDPLLSSFSSNLWLANFGVARIGAQNPNDMTEETGTLGYVAPKVTKEHNPYVKYWLGLTFYLPHCECSIDTCYLGTKLSSSFNCVAKEEFENLCLILGIELDAVTTEKAIIRKEKHIEEEEADDDEEVIYK
ncbi:hypothetical protein Bca4012_070664 [Brassica carinata]